MLLPISALLLLFCATTAADAEATVRTMVEGVVETQPLEGEVKALPHKEPKKLVSPRENAEVQIQPIKTKPEKKTIPLEDGEMHILPFNGKDKKLVMPLKDSETVHILPYTGKPEKQTRPLEDGKMHILPFTGKDKKLAEGADKVHILPYTGKPKKMPLEDGAVHILPYTGKPEIATLIKSSLEKLRAGRGLINIERIDKIDIVIRNEN